MAHTARTVYVQSRSDGTLSTFAIVSGGQLAPLGTTARSPRGQGAIAVAPNGRYLYAAEVPNAKVVSTGSVSTFAIGAGGLLTPRGRAIAIAGIPNAIVASPSGKDLFVGAAGQVFTLSIAADGTLSQVGGPVTSPFSDAPGLAVLPNGQNLYTADSFAGTLSRFSINAGGGLSKVGASVPSGSSTGSKPWGLAVSPNGRYVFAANRGLGSVSTFSVGAGGALIQLGTGVHSGPGPYALSVSPSGHNLYATNSGGGTVSAYSIRSDGALTPLAAVSTGLGPGAYPDSLVVSPNGRNVYVIDGEFQKMTTFVVGAGGALVKRLALTPAGSSPAAVVVSPPSGPAAAFSGTAKAGSRRLTLTTLPASVCQLRSARLPVSVISSGSLSVRSVRFAIGAGGNASAKRLPALGELSLRGLKPGSHTVKVRVMYLKRGRTATVTITAPVRIC
jgi:6-phosphogluconolactonase